MKHLSSKPFYFLTDRDTNFTFLVTPTDRTLYYPDTFQQSPPARISSTKKRFVAKFLSWGIRNKAKMTPHDFAIVFSRVFDGLGLIAFGLMAALITKRLLSKIQTPFIESMLAEKPLNLNGIKNMVALLVPIPLVYNRVAGTLEQKYLFDLGLEYQYNFDRTLKDSNCEDLLESASKARFDGS